MNERVRVVKVLSCLTSGSARIALRTALSLDPQRYAITFVTGGEDCRATGANGVLSGAEAIRGAPAYDLLASALDAGMSVVRVPSLVPGFSPRRDTAALRSLARLFADGEFDTVHTYGRKAGLLGRLVAVSHGTPRIVHTITGFPQQRGPSRGLATSIERRLGHRTDMLIAVGSAVATEAVRRRLAPPDRIRTVLPAPSSATAPRGTAARGRARRWLELPPGVRIVGMVGRIDEKRAPDDWVSALAAVANTSRGQDVWGVWLGDGPLRERLLARARRLGVAGRLRVISNVTDAVELLPAFDIFAYASKWLALPPEVVDAIAAGVSIVTTAGVGAPDLLVPGETALLVPAGRPDLMGQAVEHLLEDQSRSQQLAANAFALWSERNAGPAPVEDVARSYC